MCKECAATEQGRITLASLSRVLLEYAADPNDLQVRASVRALVREAEIVHDNWARWSGQCHGRACDLAWRGMVLQEGENAYVKALEWAKQSCPACRAQTPYGPIRCPACGLLILTSRPYVPPRQVQRTLEEALAELDKMRAARGGRVSGSAAGEVVREPKAKKITKKVTVDESPETDLRSVWLQEKKPPAPSTPKTE